MSTYLKGRKNIEEWMELILRDMGTYAFRLFTDELPKGGTFPWIVDSPVIWYESPGILGEIRAQLWKHVVKIRDEDALKVELSYSKKWRPRNCKIGEAVYDMIWGPNGLVSNLRVPLPKNWDGNKFNLTVPLIKLIMRKMGLGKTKGTKISTLASLKPTKAQAAIGFTYDTLKGHLFRGHKGDCFEAVKLDAKRTACHLQQDERISWDMGENEARQLIRELALFYIPLLRIDSKPLDPRAIFGGNTKMYCLEQWQLSGLVKDMKSCEYFAYHPMKTKDRIGKMVFNGVKKFLQGDLKHWDRSINAQAIMRTWQAVCELYELDTNIMVTCGIYNAYAPILLPANNELKLFHKSGVQPSGSGGFVPINNILNFCFQLITTMNILYEKFGDKYTVEEYVDMALKFAGQTFGDDFFWADLVGESDWSGRLLGDFGVTMKPSATLISEKIVVMVSKFFNIYEGTVEPIVMRRGRNALCPTFDPFDRSDEADLKIAQAYRAQSLEIKNGYNITGKEGYKDLWKFWKDSICPEDRMMLELNDAELSRLAQQYNVKHDSLHWVKKMSGVADSRDRLVD